MAISVVQSKGVHASVASTTPNVTLTSTATSGNLLVALIVSSTTNAAMTVSGWTPLTSFSSSTGSNRFFWKVSNGTESTITGSAASTAYDMYAWELNGVDTSVPVDVENAASPTGTHPTYTSVAVTPTASASRIVIAVVGHNTSTTVWSSATIGGTSVTPLTTGGNFFCAAGSLIVASTSGAYSMTASAGSGTGAGCSAIVIIKAAAAAVAPTVTSTAVSDTGATEVTAGGNVTADGGASVTERGIVWATTANPTTANNKVIDGGSGTGVFTDNITGLTASNTYHYRAYAINSVGTSYGADIQFTTAGQMLNNYQFVRAGDGMSVSERIR